MVMLGLVMRSHLARGHATAAAAPETFVAGGNGFRTVSPHGVRARRRVTVLGHGLSDLLTIGRRLGPGVARAQQCNANCNEDPRHSAASFFEVRLSPRTPPGTYWNG
jgi:hypothetical protein